MLAPLFYDRNDESDADDVDSDVDINLGEQNITSLDFDNDNDNSDMEDLKETLWKVILHQIARHGCEVNKTFLNGEAIHSHQS